jgi:hypothetical protein
MQPDRMSCTGMCWGLKSGKAAPSPGSRDSLQRLRIEKSFAFQKTDNGSWRCKTMALQPADFGVAVGGVP